MSDEREGEKPFRITVTNEMMAAVRAHREAREKLRH